ncbi:MAG: hypothetical protein KC543_00975 [Myxococcales bacterium]|nr:hypothetical protein [Myxococcales bacterium]
MQTLRRWAMYEVWRLDGEHTRLDARFRLVDDALRYVEANRHRGSFAVKKPDGGWYEHGRSVSGVFVKDDEAG